MKENYTYILRCADDTLYTGWTNDLEKRLQTHAAGKGECVEVVGTVLA